MNASSRDFILPLQRRKQNPRNRSARTEGTKMNSSNEDKSNRRFSLPGGTYFTEGGEGERFHVLLLGLNSSRCLIDSRWFTGCATTMMLLAFRNRTCRRMMTMFLMMMLLSFLAGRLFG